MPQLLSSFVSWLADNKLGASVIALAITGAFLSLQISGCDTGDLIKVSTPPAAQKALGIPAKMSLNDSEVAYEQYRLSGEQWQSAIEGGKFWSGLIASLGTTAIDVGVASLPTGSLVSLLVGSFGGLLIKRPGDQKKEDARVATEKESSYKAGLRKGEELSRLATLALGPTA